MSECQRIICSVEDPLRAYSLNGLPPVELPAVETAQITNQTVYYDFPCEDEITYSGTLPGWISIDQAGRRIVGASGTFTAATLLGANQQAQSALNEWAGNAIMEGTLVCGGEATCTGEDTNEYQIQDYSDGLVANTEGDAPVGGEVVFDGLMQFKATDSPCEWISTYAPDGPALLMDGLTLCDCRAYFEAGVPDIWVLEFYAGGQILWRGEKTTGSSPAGTYALDAGSSVDTEPATLTVVSAGGATTDQDKWNCLPT